MFSNVQNVDWYFFLFSVAKAISHPLSTPPSLQAPTGFIFIRLPSSAVYHLRA
jgi:hypothetical protein